MDLILLMFALILGMTSCEQNTQAAWQEQYDLGIRCLSDGNCEEAILAFTTAIEIDPKRPDAFLGRVGCR